VRALPRAAAASDGGALHGCFAVREAVCGRSPQRRGVRGERRSDSGRGRLLAAALQCARRYVGGRRRAGESAARETARAEVGLLAARCDSAGSPAGVCGSWRRAATQRGRRPVCAGVGRGRGAHAQVACRVWQRAMRTSTSRSRKRPGWPK